MTNRVEQGGEEIRSYEMHEVRCKRIDLDAPCSCDGSAQAGRLQYELAQSTRQAVRALADANSYAKELLQTKDGIIHALTSEVKTLYERHPQETKGKSFNELLAERVKSAKSQVRSLPDAPTRTDEDPARSP